MLDLNLPVSSLKGIGSRKANQLRKLGVETLDDMLRLYPRRYEDRRKILSLDSIVPGEITASKVKIVSLEESLSSVKKTSLSRAIVSDGTGLASVLWFNRKLKTLLTPGTEIALYGKVEVDRGLCQFLSPEFEIIVEEREPSIIGSIMPIYPLTYGISSIWMRKTMKKALHRLLPFVRDLIPSSITEELGLWDLKSSIRELHLPSSSDNWRKARRRLAFEELFLLQLGLAMRKKGQNSNIARPFPCDESTFSMVQSLFPFSFTSDQKKVIGQISRDLSLKVPMNRLLQGDVGSGKTAVAVVAMMQVVNGGGQAALMVPTSVLAQQHYVKISSILEPLGVRVGLLLGAMKTSERSRELEAIESGQVSIVIGTHALIQDSLSFRELGLIVIDEQHRFGVLQRGALYDKGLKPHTLVMTATPIPRTLALSVYGDLSLSTIRTLPVGRVPVKTRWIPDRKVNDLYGFIDSELARGRRVFWICPIIEESDVLDVEPLENRYETLSSYFGKDRLCMLHGRMALDERESVMDSFVKGDRPLMASTTVIEVGVDVPEATVMVVENSERFGLSQLHQLRGRVGRNDEQCWCFLLGNPKTDEGKRRIKILCSSNDGFDVAQEDLRLRGPGEICGVRQHGLSDFKVANLVRDGALLELARDKAFEVISEDPDLVSHEELKKIVVFIYGEKLKLAGTA